MILEVCSRLAYNFDRGFISAPIILSDPETLFILLKKVFSPHEREVVPPFLLDRIICSLIISLEISERNESLLSFRRVLGIDSSSRQSFLKSFHSFSQRKIHDKSLYYLNLATMGCNMSHLVSSRPPLSCVDDFLSSILSVALNPDDHDKISAIIIDNAIYKLLLCHVLDATVSFSSFSNPSISIPEYDISKVKFTVSSQSELLETIISHQKELPHLISPTTFSPLISGLVTFFSQKSSIYPVLSFITQKKTPEHLHSVHKLLHILSLCIHHERIEMAKSGSLSQSKNRTHPETNESSIRGRRKREKDRKKRWDDEEDDSEESIPDSMSHSSKSSSLSPLQSLFWHSWFLSMCLCSTVCGSSMCIIDGIHGSLVLKYINKTKSHPIQSYIHPSPQSTSTSGTEEMDLNSLFLPSVFSELSSFSPALCDLFSSLLLSLLSHPYILSLLTQVFKGGKKSVFAQIFPLYCITVQEILSQIEGNSSSTKKNSNQISGSKTFDEMPSISSYTSQTSSSQDHSILLTSGESVPFGSPQIRAKDDAQGVHNPYALQSQLAFSTSSSPVQNISIDSSSFDASIALSIPTHDSSHCITSSSSSGQSNEGSVLPPLSIIPRNEERSYLSSFSSVYIKKISELEDESSSCVIPAFSIFSTPSEFSLFALHLCAKLTALGELIVSCKTDTKSPDSKSGDSQSASINRNSQQHQPLQCVGMYWIWWELMCQSMRCFLDPPKELLPASIHVQDYTGLRSSPNLNDDITLFSIIFSSSLFKDVLTQSSSPLIPFGEISIYSQRSVLYTLRKSHAFSSSTFLPSRHNTTFSFDIICSLATSYCYHYLSKLFRSLQIDRLISNNMTKDDGSEKVTKKSTKVDKTRRSHLSSRSPSLSFHRSTPNVFSSFLPSSSLHSISVSSHSESVSSQARRIGIISPKHKEMIARSTELPNLSRIISLLKQPSLIDLNAYQQQHLKRLRKALRKHTAVGTPSLYHDVLSISISLHGGPDSLRQILAQCTPQNINNWSERAQNMIIHGGFEAYNPKIDITSLWKSVSAEYFRDNVFRSVGLEQLIFGMQFLPSMIARLFLDEWRRVVAKMWKKTRKWKEEYYMEEMNNLFSKVNPISKNRFISLFENPIQQGDSVSYIDLECCVKASYLLYLVCYSCSDLSTLFPVILSMIQAICDCIRECICVIMVYHEICSRWGLNLGIHSHIEPESYDISSDNVSHVGAYISESLLLSLSFLHQAFTVMNDKFNILSVSAGLTVGSGKRRSSRKIIAPWLFAFIHTVLECSIFRNLYQTSSARIPMTHSSSQSKKALSHELSDLIPDVLESSLHIISSDLSRFILSPSLDVSESAFISQWLQVYLNIACSYKQCSGSFSISELISHDDSRKIRRRISPFSIVTKNLSQSSSPTSNSSSIMQIPNIIVSLGQGSVYKLTKHVLGFVISEHIASMLKYISTSPAPLFLCFPRFLHLPFFLSSSPSSSSSPIIPLSQPLSNSSFLLSQAQHFTPSQWIVALHGIIEGILCQCSRIQGSVMERGNPNCFSSLHTQDIALCEYVCAKVLVSLFWVFIHDLRNKRNNSKYLLSCESKEKDIIGKTIEDAALLASIEKDFPRLYNEKMPFTMHLFYYFSCVISSSSSTIINTITIPALSRVLSCSFSPSVIFAGISTVLFISSEVESTIEFLSSLAVDLVSKGHSFETDGEALSSLDRVIKDDRNVLFSMVFYPLLKRNDLKMGIIGIISQCCCEMLNILLTLFCRDYEDPTILSEKAQKRQEMSSSDVNGKYKEYLSLKSPLALLATNSAFRNIPIHKLQELILKSSFSIYICVAVLNSKKYDRSRIKTLVKQHLACSQCFSCILNTSLVGFSTNYPSPSRKESMMKIPSSFPKIEIDQLRRTSISKISQSPSSNSNPINAGIYLGRLWLMGGNNSEKHKLFDHAEGLYLESSAFSIVSQDIDGNRFFQQSFGLPWGQAGCDSDEGKEETGGGSFDLYSALAAEESSETDRKAGNEKSIHENSVQKLSKEELVEFVSKILPSSSFYCIHPLFEYSILESFFEKDPIFSICSKQLLATASFQTSSKLYDGISEKSIGIFVFFICSFSLSLSQTLVSPFEALETSTFGANWDDHAFLVNLIVSLPSIFRIVMKSIEKHSSLASLKRIVTASACVCLKSFALLVQHRVTDFVGEVGLSSELIHALQQFNRILNLDECVSQLTSYFYSFYSSLVEGNSDHIAHIVNSDLVCSGMLDIHSSFFASCSFHSDLLIEPLRKLSETIFTGYPSLSHETKIFSTILNADKKSSEIISHKMLFLAYKSIMENSDVDLGEALQIIINAVEERNSDHIAHIVNSDLVCSGMLDIHSSFFASCSFHSDLLIEPLRKLSETIFTGYPSLSHETKIFSTILNADKKSSEIISHKMLFLAYKSIMENSDVDLGEALQIIINAVEESGMKGSVLWYELKKMILPEFEEEEEEYDEDDLD
ncbi:hypothetical protein ADUPG1_000611 [Aduncisulcus paluster]|uniref:Non-specific serine/threonine protein kinase n=1 Tax=Aduncisulcus paluster TaxID=2918883 RepID=A0ABQ5KA66_9EUKA|nr:hypothetical protein ADUPG1_000611 [Aduncisulcus paluster]